MFSSVLTMMKVKFSSVLSWGLCLNCTDYIFHITALGPETLQVSDVVPKLDRLSPPVKQQISKSLAQSGAGRWQLNTSAQRLLQSSGDGTPQRDRSTILKLFRQRQV